MFKYDKLASIISSYQKEFPTLIKDEIYKWKAVKHFQDHWDIDAEDFLSMFMEATDKTHNLLASMNFYPRAMIKALASADPEAVRSMFRALYDESRAFTDRIEEFIASAEDLRVRYNDGTWVKHYQNTNAVTTYLWLRYPDEYYIYKYSEVCDFAKLIDNDFIPKKGGSTKDVEKAKEFYDEVRKVLKRNNAIVSLVAVSVGGEGYPDFEMVTTTIDLGFYASRYYMKKTADSSTAWEPKNYSPNISISKWKELLQDHTVFNETSLQIMKRFLDYGGEATCKQLSVKYGETPGFYNLGSSSLGKRIAKKTQCPVMNPGDPESENAAYWPILYLGRSADKSEDGVYVWKIRDELKAALNQTDLSSVALFADDKKKNNGKTSGYWWLNANPKIWSFANINIGEEHFYTLYNDNGHKRKIFQNFLDAKEGDIVIGYESYPVKQIVALARISTENDGKNLYFEKTESLAVPIDYSTLKSCPELAHMEYFVSPQGSLFKLSKGEFDFIMDIIRESNPVEAGKEKCEIYSKKDFLNQVFMSEEQYDTLVGLLHNKKNLILQGAPGVGKTYAAIRLAYSMMGQKDDSRIKFIQFHQNYSYEDFVMGYKPQEDGFKLENGIFYQFCLKAANHPDEDYFFIIDEINRGNMSKIFGELLMAIEKDHRNEKVTLAYTGTLFAVPDNLYIIGMMNTADRSLAMIDYALRRRFSFFDMVPGFHTDGFKSYQASLDNDTFNDLIQQVIELNIAIRKDESLGDGFCIGHSYFCNQKTCTDEWMKSIVFYEIIPMLKEYWFDDKEKVQTWENKLSGVFND